MPKNKKKRKLDASVNLLSNLTGFEDATNESMADCLAEFQQYAAPQDEIAQSTGENETGAKHNQQNLEEIESWNRSFHAWMMKGGTYTPSLLPNIDEELSRNFKVKELSSFLLGSGNDLRMPVFERWLLDSKFEEDRTSDPVLPVSASPDSDASVRLRKELVHNGLELDGAEKVVAELCRKTNYAGHELVSQMDRYQRQSPLKKGDRIDIEDHPTSVSLIYSRKKWKKPFCFKLNKSHYEKLEDRFFQIHNRVSTKLDRDSAKTKKGFNILVLALLLRYSALSGEQTGWTISNFVDRFPSSSYL